MRWAFWTVGLVSGALTCYTTRFFINGDALAYVEIGEALREGWCWGLGNLTYSPGYGVLLGLGQIVLNTNPLNELQLLRVVNFLILVAAMWACDKVIHYVNTDLMHATDTTSRSLPLVAVNALCYSMFLVAALIWVRMRLISPDILLLCMVLLTMATILWIRNGPSSRLNYKYIVLGLCLGAGYLAKSWFLPFSPVFLALAGLAADSWKRAMGRVAVAALVMLLVAAPLIAALSYRMGRPSFGELGKLAYVTWVGGEGQPVNPPTLLNKDPPTNLYEYWLPCTDPRGFDICYWNVGIVPNIDLRAHMIGFARNAWTVIEQTPWLIFIALWFLWQLRLGSFAIGCLRPPSLFVLLMPAAVTGIALFCLMHVEMRYIAPFLFLGFVGLVAALRYPSGDEGARVWATAGAFLIVMGFAGLLAHSLVDQTVSGVYGTGKKPSFEEKFAEHVAVKDLLNKRGLRAGDRVAILGAPPVYWARMARVRIAGEIPDSDRFMNVTSAQRASAIQSLKRAGVKAVVAKGDRLEKLKAERWQQVDQTRDFHVLFLAHSTAGITDGVP